MAKRFEISLTQDGVEANLKEKYHFGNLITSLGKQLFQELANLSIPLIYKLKMVSCLVLVRLGRIMLENLPSILFPNSQNFTYNSQKFYLLFSKTVKHVSYCKGYKY